jgi:hypothetical protein
MVMRDHIWSPQPFPLIDKHDIVSYDVGDEKAFFALLHYYNTHDLAARTIAARGAYHAQRFMSPTTVDYVLCTAELLSGRDHNYIRTGPAILKDINSLYLLGGLQFDYDI